ncbi:MotE family protein [Peribacillus muralis]|uniref:MotE family protein n=1 Tax=Peribacillus muralis TaxID=264697 RepID=UPI00070D7E7A|nr:MotE family protein [Peribacillus muralis]
MRKKIESNGMEELEESKISKFQWFLVIFIPLIFAVTVALIVLTVAGVNVMEKAKEMSASIPFIDTDKKDEERGSAARSDEKVTIKLEKLATDIENKQKEIEKLEGIIDTRDKAIAKAEAEKQQLQMEMNQLKDSQSGKNKAFKDIIRTYETMAPKKSAPIITEMNDQDALEILSSMKATTLAKVLENMSTADAARLTKKLAEQSTQEER